MAVSFDWKKRLGAGHFGEVWHAIDVGLNAERAVKLIQQDKVLDPNNIFHEAQVLKNAEHLNVVKVEETGTLADGRIYVAMEYLPKGSLEDEAKGGYVALTRAHRIMVDALRGLEYAHSKGILHRDIKPANILVGQNCEGKLSDFGLAVPANLNLNALGVKDYAYLLHLAPEIHEGGTYGVRSDIYAAGMTLYRLVNGDMYLPSVPANEIQQLCIDGHYPDRGKYRDFVPRSLRQLINRAMEVDASRRFPTAEAMRHALERVVLRMNWNEQVLSQGLRWSATRDSRCYEVTRLPSADGKWSVQVRKGPSGRMLRRLTKLCRDGLSARQADQAARRILQGYVLGKLQ